MPATVTCVDLDGKEQQVQVSDLRWRPSAYAIVVQDGKLLLAKERGKYTLPGGGIELGEQPEQAVIREVKEETGIDAAVGQLLACRSEFFTHHGQARDIHSQTVLLYYRCTATGGELSTDWLPVDERSLHGMPEWVSLDRLDTIDILNRYDWRQLVRSLAAA